MVMPCVVPGGLCSLFVNECIVDCMAGEPVTVTNCAWIERVIVGVSVGGIGSVVLDM